MQTKKCCSCKLPYENSCTKHCKNNIAKLCINSTSIWCANNYSIYSTIFVSYTEQITKPYSEQIAAPSNMQCILPNGVQINMALRNKQICENLPCQHFAQGGNYRAIFPSCNTMEAEYGSVLKYMSYLQEIKVFNRKFTHF